MTIAYRKAWVAGYRPESAMTVSEWADKHRFLAQKSSSEPGLWRTARTPYLRDIMDDLSPSSAIERVIFMKGAQIGGTEAGNNWLGYIIHQAAGPALSVSPTLDIAKKISQQRIDPLIEESPVLSRLVAPAKSRDSGNRQLMKEFPGGTLMLTGANSASGLRSMPIRYLFLDEIDAFPADADNEGDPVNLAIRRTANFLRRKILMVSTPTVEGVSRIEAEFEKTDQRRYFLPCLKCGEMQTLDWERIVWSNHGLAPEDAHFECRACNHLMANHDKQEMLAAGEWRPTADGNPKFRGYHLSSLYSPPGWYSWGDAAESFLEDMGNPQRLKVWTNTVLGETFREKGEAPEWQRLYAASEPYRRGSVPEGGLILTAGVDVQQDRLEAEVTAWGRDMESWSVDYQIIDGDPYQQDVWRELAKLLNRSFEHEGGGLLTIARMAVDTGYATQAVYHWCRQQTAARVMAIKGDSRTKTILGQPTPVDVSYAGRRIRRGLRLWSVGVDLLKSQLYGWLKQERDSFDTPPPPGWCHFPKYGEEYFKQLCAEALVRKRLRSGQVRLEWQPNRERNEALDCRLYGMAAAMAVGIDRFTDEAWRKVSLDRQIFLNNHESDEKSKRVFHSHYLLE